MEKKYILAIDIGTQSVRAMCFDQKGQLIANERIVSEPCHAKRLGWVEAKPNSFWENVCYCTNKVREKIKDDVKYIKAISLTTNRDNILCVDKDGNPLRDWITWMDQRLCPEAVKGTKSNISKSAKVIRYAKKSFFDMVSERSKFNWLKYNEPEIYKNTYKFLTLCGHITYKMTGLYHDAVGLQMGVYPYDIKNFEFFRIKGIYEIIGVERERLADKVFQAGEVMGTLSKQAAKETGLLEGIPIVAAGADKQCETVGAGAKFEEEAVISYGTMAAISVLTQNYVASKNMSFYTWASSYPNKFNPEFYVDRGYWLVTWFCTQYAKEQDHPSFLLKMNEQASHIPPGCNGLLVFPFWAPHYVVYPHGKGVLLGFTDDHTPAHVYKAILESIAYALKDGLKLIEKASKKKIKRLLVVGGGSKSDVAMQLTADIFNIDVVRLSSNEIGAIGAVAIGGYSVGMFPSIEEGVDSLIKPIKVFKPIKENVEVYEDLYNNVYKKLYKNNLESFKHLEKYAKIKPAY